MMKTKLMMLKPSSDSPLFNDMDKNYAEMVLNAGYQEGLRGYDFAEMMLNLYPMDFRWAFKTGFYKGLDQYKRNILKDLVLGDTNDK